MKKNQSFEDWYFENIDQPGQSQQLSTIELIQVISRYLTEHAEMTKQAAFGHEPE